MGGMLTSLWRTRSGGSNNSGIMVHRCTGHGRKYVSEENPGPTAVYRLIDQDELLED
jgi:hypothetical protein